MYRIIRCSDGAVLYDVNDPDTCPMTEPRGTFEIGQPGSLQFSLVPAHPLYDGVEVMETYVSAYKDNTEIFYGRVIDVNHDKATGIKQVECAGAIQFLEDGEIAPIQAEEQPSSGSNNSDGESSDQEKGVQMTAAAFFSRCISDFNADIGNDPRRKFEVGHIWPEKAGEIQTYNISSYTQAKSAIESNLISEYGGYLRARRGDQNKLYLDWIGSYDEPNTSPIRLRENVISQENAISANGLFTVIRPIGKDNLGLTSGTMVVDPTLVSKYGRIIKTVTFSYADTQELLAYAAQKYINEIATGTSHIGTIKLVDMHFLDNSVPSIRLGSTYTNIAGFEGERMVIAGMELNFASPADDSITLKNRRELEANQKDGTSGRGSLSKKLQEAEKGQKGFQNIWQHITEGEDWLRLHAKKIEINATNLKEQVSTFERYAAETNEKMDLQGQEVQAIKGTGVYQSSDRITQVAGLFTSTYGQVPTASYTGRVPKTAGWFEIEYYYITEEDIKSGVEIYASTEAAAAGIPINTMDEAEMKRLIEEGKPVIHLIPTDDMEPREGKSYFMKDLGLINGTSFSVTEDGLKTNIGNRLSVAFEKIDETKELSIDNQIRITTMQGSALWGKEEQLVAFCGKYRIERGPDGKETLIFEKGGGIKVEENGTQFGLFTEDNLDAGVIVGWINDPENANIVDGTKVNINASQVTAGSHTNVEAWLTSQGQDISRINGLITDKIWTADLSALYAEINNIKADYLNADDVMSGNLQVGTLGAGSLECGPIDCEGISTPDIDCTDVNCTFINGYEPKDFLASGDVSPDGKTLTLYNAAGTPVVTFNKAATAELSGSWSGTTFTVTATPSDSARPNIVQGKVWGSIVPVYGTTEYDETNKNVSMNMLVYSEEGGEAGSVIIRQRVSISADDAFEAGAKSARSSYLNGVWDGAGTYTVTAMPQGTPTTSTELGSISLNGSVTTSKGGYTLTVPCKVTAEGSESAIFTDNVTVSAKDAYDNGVDSVTMSSITVDGTPKPSDTSITVKGTASNGESKTLIISITDQRKDAYSSGWNAAVALISRSGNSIVGPISGAAFADKNVETKYTANYKSSGCAYVPSSYSASSHSYKASAASFSQASCTVNNVTHSKNSYSGNLIGKVTVSYSPASYTYSASVDSYAASSYTKETVAYTPSTFSWS